MGSSASNSSGSKGDWTARVHFWNGKYWVQIPTDKLIQYFQDELEAEEEIIIGSEIRIYDLGLIQRLFGFSHESTLVETTNWYWSFEKMLEGLFVQRSKNIDDMRCKFAGEDRPCEDRSDGRSSHVSNGENVLDIVIWILNRKELDKTYHLTGDNFASVLHEAITRTKGNRRLSNTE